MTETSPLVSVGVPSYNRPRELLATVKYLLEQPYQNVEVIVSDNGSPHSVERDTIKEMARTDPRLRYFRQDENIGSARNFDFVLSQATGDYYMWCSDDDWRHQNYIAELVAVLVRHPSAVLAFCDYREVNVRHEPIGKGRSRLGRMNGFTNHTLFLRSAAYFLQVDRLGKANCIYGLYRRPALQGISFSDLFNLGALSSDMMLVYKVLQRGPLALSSQMYWSCTVGNEKFYRKRSVSGNWHLRLSNYISLFFFDIWLSFQYITLSDNSIRILISLLFPFRALIVSWGWGSDILRAALARMWRLGTRD